MKDKIISQVGVPVIAGRPRQSQSVFWWSGMRATIAAFVILTQSMMLESIGQTSVPPDPGNRLAQTSPSPLALLVEQGRRHPSYPVFAGQLTLPEIIVVDATTLEVGGKQKLEVSRLNQLTPAQSETLASQFEVPVGVMNKFLESCSNNASADSTQVADKLRFTVIDYKYLLERWNQYHPPVENEPVKAEALLALRTGDIDHAWELYVALPKPNPPTGFRIAGQN